MLRQKMSDHHDFDPEKNVMLSYTVCPVIHYEVFLVNAKAVLASYNAAPHNRYEPHPAEPEQYTKCSNTVFVLLKMGIMMPETC